MPQDHTSTRTDRTNPQWGIDHNGRAFVRSAAAEPAVSRRIARLAAAVRVAPNEARRAQLVHEFWSSVGRSGTPLVEPAGPGMVVVTFVWRGEPATGEVLALVNRVTDRRDLGSSAMRRVEGTDVWQLGYRMADDWLASYQIAPDFPPLPTTDPAPRGTAAGPNGAGTADLGAQVQDRLLAQARPDPLARHRLPSVWGGSGFSAVVLPRAPRLPEWQESAVQPSRGRLTRHRVAGLAGPVWLYEPVCPQDGPLDLLVMLDGQVWAETAGLAAALDQLIGSGALPPVAAVLPQAPDGPRRTQHFAGNPELLTELAEIVLPWARSRCRIADDPARRVLCGQSMGGLAAVWAATRLPESFGVALSQSGSFWWPAHGAGGQWLAELIDGGPPAELAVTAELAVGRREVLLTEPTRRLAEVLAGRGHRVRLTEYNGGHDLLWWRLAVTAGLRATLGSGLVPGGGRS